MQLTPVYGDRPLLALDVPPEEVATATVRQRTRFAEVVAAMGPDELAAPSRCAGWSNRDVLVHLDGTNAFWGASIQAGRRGQPTRYLTEFDPVATPAALVAGQAGTDAAQVVERFVASTRALVDLVGSLDDDDWSRPAEAPPGHVAILAVVHHALWDSWVHERDVLLPLGRRPEHHDDEVLASLRYAAALSPALALAAGAARPGVLEFRASAPDAVVRVEVTDQVRVGDGAQLPDGAAPADVELAGDAVELLEALSVRGPLPAEVPPTWSWMTGALRSNFEGVGDQPPEGSTPG